MSNIRVVKVYPVNYNNKTRKGEHIKVNLSVNNKPIYRVYKYDDAFPEFDIYVRMAVESVTSGRRIRHNEAKRRISRSISGGPPKSKAGSAIRRGRSIKVESQLRTGAYAITKTIEELHDNPKQAYEELLRNIVRDKDLMDIVIENRDKFKHRMWYRAKITGEITDIKQRAFGIDDVKMGDIGYVEDNNKTIDNFTTQYLKAFRSGTIIELGKDKKVKDKAKSLLQTNKGRDALNYDQMGRIKRNEVQVWFTKGSP